MSAASTTTLILVRHGETTLNLEHRFRGRADPPLTEHGVDQARSVAQRGELTGAAVIYTSPRQRAAATATAIGSGTRTEMVAKDPRLDDIDYGEWTALTGAESAERWPALHREWLARPEQLRFPRGEAIADVVVRAREAIEVYRTKHEGGTIVAVTHDVIIRILLCSMLDAPLAAMHRLRIDLTSLSILEWTPEVSIVRVNDVRHVAAPPKVSKVPLTAGIAAGAPIAM